MRRNENEFERLKDRLLRYKLVAYFLCLIITNLPKLINIYRFFFPYRKLGLQTEFQKKEDKNAKKNSRSSMPSLWEESFSI